MQEIVNGQNSILDVLHSIGVEFDHFRFDDKFNTLINNYENCLKGINCNQNLYMQIKKTIFGNYIFINKND